MLSVDSEQNSGMSTSPSRGVFKWLYSIVYNAYENRKRPYRGLVIHAAIGSFEGVFCERREQLLIKYENILWRRINEAYKRSRYFSEYLD